MNEDTSPAFVAQTRFRMPAASNAKRDRLPRFQQRASDAGLDMPGEGDRSRRRTAFTPSQPVFDVRMFAGRQELLLKLIRAIEDQHLHVVLYGDRGMGKTSVLHVLATLAREARYIVRYTSCSETSSFGDLFRTIAADIPALFHADTDPTSERGEQAMSLADMLPSGDLSVSQVSEVFAKLTGTRVLVILDEFDRAESSEFRRSIAELIKNLSDRGTRLQLVIAGVAPNLTELIQHIPSIRRNIAGLAMPNMDTAEMLELLQIGADRGGLTFDPEATALVTTVANGSPYLTSLVGQHAAIVAADREAEDVARDDVVQAIDRATGEIEVRVSSRSLAEIARIDDPALRALLTQAAGESLRNIGRIDAAPGTDDARGRGLHDLAEGYALLERDDDDATGAYRFREDGVALFTWIAAHRGHAPAGA